MGSEAGLPVVVRADRSERLAVGGLAFVCLCGAAVAASNGSGWGFAFLGVAGAGLSVGTWVVVRSRIVFDMVGIHRRSLTTTTIPWDRVRAARATPIDRSNGRRGVAILLDDLTAIPLALPAALDVTPSMVDVWRSAFAGPVTNPETGELADDNLRVGAGSGHPGHHVEGCTSRKRPNRQSGAPLVIARARWPMALPLGLFVIWIGLFAAALASVVDVGSSAKRLVWPVVVVLTALMAMVGRFLHEIRRQRVVVTDEGVVLPDRSRTKPLRWDEVDRFVALGWPEGRRWALAAVQGPAVQRLALPSGVGWTQRPHAEVHRIATTLNTELVRRRSRHAPDTARRAGEAVLAPRRPWRPASRRGRALFLAGLGAGCALFAALGVWQATVSSQEHQEVEARARSVPATVVAFDPDETPGTAVLRYAVGTGEYELRVSYGANLLAVGDVIWIRYDPLDPSDGWAPPYGSSRSTPRDGVVFALALAAMVSGIAALVRWSMWRQHPRSTGTQTPVTGTERGPSGPA